MKAIKSGIVVGIILFLMWFAWCVKYAPLSRADGVDSIVSQ